jgi:phosphatidylglycerol:prolipoprotein diacylglycerol transferase
VHPVAFHLGSVSVNWYGVLVALAFLTGLWTASRRSPRDCIAPERIADFGPWAIIGAIVGSRALYVISYWREDFSGKPPWEIFMIRHGGLVFYGGLIGAALAGILFARLKKLPLWKFADVLAPSIALGFAIGRIGCLMNGCCYGRHCDLPWAIRFPSDHATHGDPVHPTEIYDSLWGFGLYLALAWLHRHKKFDGQVFGVFLVAYAVLRSYVEFYRGDYAPEKLFGSLTPAQVASVVVLAFGLSMLWLLPRRPAKVT